MALWLVVLFTSQLRSSWDRTNSLKNSWLETNQSDFWNKIRNHSWVKYVKNNKKRKYKTMHITILWTSQDVLTEKSEEKFWVRQYWKAIEKIREIRVWRRLLKWFDRICFGRTIVLIYFHFIPTVKTVTTFDRKFFQLLFRF